jgi:hypothetical protein
VHNEQLHENRTVLCSPRVEASVGVSLTKNLPIIKHANKNENIPGNDQDRSALPVWASAHSSNARSKAHPTEKNILGVRYMNCKESNVRGGAGAKTRKMSHSLYVNEWRHDGKEGHRLKAMQLYLYER